MYEDYFGFTDTPFRLTPGSGGIFWSSGHVGAAAALERGIRGGALITVVTGDVGTGKTTLIRQLVNNSSPGETLGLVSSYTGGRGDIMHWVLLAFDVDFEGLSETELMGRFSAFIEAEYKEGRRVVLIVDEAQSLSDQGLETLRLSTNINRDENSRYSLVLVGQPELEKRLEATRFLALRSRVTEWRKLEVLTREETRDYIDDRLAAVGGKPEIFSDGAVDEIFRITDGTPRLINLLADLCLATAFGADAGQVDRELIEEVVADAKKKGIYNSLTSERGIESPPVEAPPVEPPPDTIIAFDAWRGEQPQPEFAEPESVYEARPRNTGPRARVIPARKEVIPEPPREEREPAPEPVEEQEPPKPEPVQANLSPGPESPGGLEFPAPQQAEEQITEPVAEKEPVSKAEPVKSAPLKGKRRMWPVYLTGAVAASLAAVVGSGALNDMVEAPPENPPAVIVAEAPPSSPAPAAPGFDLRGEGGALVHDASLTADEIFTRALDVSLTDPVTGALGFARAAIRGNGQAAYFLAQLYETGAGTPLDFGLARAWYEIAAPSRSSAARRLENMAPIDPKGTPEAPRPWIALQGREKTEFVWSSADGPDPMEYELEVAALPSEGVLASWQTRLSALYVELPPGAAWWRITAIGGDGEAATPWMMIDSAPPT